MPSEPDPAPPEAAGPQPPDAGRIAADHQRLVSRLRSQAESATTLGSPLYAHLLGHVAQDVADHGVCWQVLAHHAHQPDGMALPLRFMAGVHRLVLRRQAPALAQHYASVGGTAGVAGAWPVFRDTVEANVEQLVDLTALGCQTNEVGRSAALGPALLWLSGHHGLPLHHMEIGTSAGLNLRFDHFRYGTHDGTATWGPPGSPVDLTGHWDVAPRGLPETVEVVGRTGCDPQPLDPDDPADRETLTASVWADMPARHARLKGALDLARRVSATIEQATAGEWLARRLPQRPDGAVTVVAHSVVWRYIPEQERQQVQDLLAAHGADATRTSPLVWLRLEPRPPRMTYDGNPYPVLATTWPGGQTLELGQAHAHGQALRWDAPPPA